MTTGARHRERGTSSLGCLFSLLIFVAAVYYGINIGNVFFRYYRLLDEMDSQARLSAALDNGTIERRLQAAVADIGLPDSAGQHMVVQRVASPREIVIETAYSETVDLPFFHHTFAFHPQATQPL